MADETSPEQKGAISDLTDWPSQNCGRPCAPNLTTNAGAGTHGREVAAGIKKGGLRGHKGEQPANPEDPARAGN